MNKQADGGGCGHGQIHWNHYWISNCGDRYFRDGDSWLGDIGSGGVKNFDRDGKNISKVSLLF